MRNNPSQRGGYEIQYNIALKGQWSGLRRDVMHCPFRAIVSCGVLPTALRWVVTHCPYRGENKIILFSH
ncbi:MAG: hypothetical protein LBC02_07135 [Planctomycetaceae bacterium]|nr:hypothetical protein [Planctomycetaceae bacterium]